MAHSCLSRGAQLGHTHTCSALRVNIALHLQTSVMTKVVRLARAPASSTCVACCLRTCSKKGLELAPAEHDSSSALSRHELLRQARLRSRCAHGSRQSAQVQGACAALTALAGVLSPGNIQLAASCSHHASPEASRCAGSPSRSLSILRAFRATISPVFRLRALSAGQASAHF